jgi:hypothetical protein
MVRQLVLAASTILVSVVCLSAFAQSAGAQTAAGAGLGPGGILNDPFTFYYAIYLPNQQLQSMRPGPLDTTNDAMAARQYYAQKDRRPLYNPTSPYSSTSDPLHPYSQQNQERLARTGRFAQDPSNSDGMGPSLYYGRVAQYYPDLGGRQSRRPNANTAGKRGMGPRSGRGGGGGGMGGGMGGMGGGMGGMGGGMGGMGGGMF